MPMDAHDPIDPISPRSFPWARTGLALGAGFAIFFAFVARDDDAPPEVVSTPVTESVPEAAADVVPPPPANANANAKSFAPIQQVPWPPGKRYSTGKSSGDGRLVEDGDSALLVQAAETFYENALSSCAPTRIALGKSVSLLCENAREESRVIIVPRQASTNRLRNDDVGGTWLRTSRTTFRAPSSGERAANRHKDADEDIDGASCGWTMRFVALPRGARVSSSGGSNDSGHCSFEVDGLPGTTWSTMLHNLFRPGTTVHKRQLDDGEVSRWTAEGWDGGWWRVDVVSASQNASAPAHLQRARVELSLWAPDEEPWKPPFSFEDKVEALQECWEPCALALKDKVQAIDREDVRAESKAEEVMDRCLYECRGTEQAPAVLEPAARAFAKAHAGREHRVIDLASDDAIP